MRRLLAGTPDLSITVTANDFDGTNDYALRGGALTGGADSSTGIFSMWFRIDGGDGTNMRVLSCITAGGEIWSFNHTTGNLIKFSLATSAGTGLFAFQSSAILAGSTWHHILASWSTDFSAGNKIAHLYVDGVNDLTIASDANPALTIGYNTLVTDYGLFNRANGPGTELWNGCVAEYYFAPGQYLDLSDSANRAKFRSGSGHPVSLGADGSTPTAVAPAVYLNNGTTTWGTNKGSGGDFTVTGTLDACSSTP